jgi:Tol biopolymer transport system component
VYANPGWLLFMTPDQALMAQRIDPASWTLQGIAQPVAGNVWFNGPSFNGSFDASLGGRVLTYMPGSAAGSALEWFDRTGKHLGRLGPERRYRAARLSPDDRQVVVEIADEQIGTRDLWLIDTATGGLQRLTSNPATDWRAVFSRDGTSMAFASDRAGVSAVFRTSANVGGEEKPLFRTPEGGVFPADWSPDGTRLLVNIDRFQGLGQRLAEVSLNGGEPTFFESADADDFSQSRYSPSGDRVAFVSRNAGAPDVYVLSIKDRHRLRVSTDGGWHPKWGADGRELFFLNTRNEITRVVLDGMTIASRPQVVFQPCAGINRTLTSVEAEAPFDVARDGRFLVNCFPPDAVPQAIHVILDWQSKVK